MNEKARGAGAALVAACVLSACGGGGGSDSGSAAPSQPAVSATNIGAAYRNLVRFPHSYSLSGSTSTGVALTATLSIAVGGSVTVNGRSYDSSTATLSVFRGGTLAATGVSTLLFSPGTTNQSWTFSSSATCDVTTSGTPLPGAMGLGQNGPYVTATKYSGCTTINLPTTLSLSSGTVVQTWALQAIEGRAYMCINSATTGFVGTATESDCVEVIDAAGTLGTHFRVTTTDLNKVTTTLSN